MMRKKNVMKLLMILTVTMLCIACGRKEEYKQKYFSLKELEHGTLAMWSGCGYEPYAEAYLPTMRLIYGNYAPDLGLNVGQQKADAALMGESFFNFYIEEMEGLTILDEDLGTIDGGMIFADTEKGRRLRSEFNEYVDEKRTDGTLDDLKEIWLLGDKSRQEVDFSGLEGHEETLYYGNSLSEPPYSFQKNNGVSGYEVDLMTRFCRAYGYNLEMSQGSYEGLITSVLQGKYDVVGAGYEIEEERGEMVSFSEPIRTDRVVVIVKEKDVEKGIIESFKASFDRTFMKENRYIKFLSGIGITLLITLASALFGTLLGFVLYFVNRDGGKLVRGMMNVVTTILERVPSLVILMILYYVIFANVAVNPILVAIIAFSILFGIGTFEKLDTAISAVGQGQSEASFTLGFSKNETFIKILFPQCLDIFLSGYKGQLIATMLETAVVGYITISDLTRVGDIIRNLTYEAFFPLIAVAVIYFLLASLIIGIIDYIQKKVNPRNKTPERILKGIDAKQKA